MPQTVMQSQRTATGTLVNIFQASARQHAKKAAMRFKRGDRWETHTYGRLAELVNHAANGLLEAGVDKGDRVAIFARNCPEWAIMDWAALHLGAVTVPIYDTLTAEKAEYILRDSGSKVCLVQSADHLNKIRSVRRKLPHLRSIILIEEIFEKSLEQGEQLFTDLVRAGQSHAKANPKDLETRAAKVKPDDIASIVYTSGTTGDPKGAILTHNNFASNVEASVERISIDSTDTFLSFLPLSHVFERMAGHFRKVRSGAEVAYAESIEKVPENMLEVKPTVMLSVPRLYEKLYARVKDKVSKDSFIKRKIFNWAVKVGKEYNHERYYLKVVNPSTEKRFKRADKLVYHKIRERTGGRLRFFVSGGAPLSKEIEEFFHAVNLPILQGYGLTETSPVISANTFEDLRFGSVGRPFPGVDVKIADDGEILCKGPLVFKGYYNKPADTGEAFTPDGFFKTGDVGRVDEDGFLYITDRKKELIVMSNGKKVAPQPIENAIKMTPGVGMAVLIGDDKKFISCLISPDLETLRSKAKELGADEGASTQALLASPGVQDHFAQAVEEVNRGLARYEQIKQFRVLPAELTQETGELTPTMKVKRRVVLSKYQELIDAMYESGAPGE